MGPITGTIDGSFDPVEYERLCSEGKLLFMARCVTQLQAGYRDLQAERDSFQRDLDRSTAKIVALHQDVSILRTALFDAGEQIYDNPDLEQMISSALDVTGEQL